MTTIELPLETMDFELPVELEATEPPEVRGRGRDDVRLLVAWKHDGRLVHARFDQLGRFLEPGDLLVVNTSATLPAAVAGDLVRPDGAVESVEVHVSTRFPGGLWVVELRRLVAASTEPLFDAARGAIVLTPGGGRVELLAPAGEASPRGVRLWIAAVDLPSPMHSYLTRYGRPITYRYVTHDWGIDAYQTIFGRHAGSAEMPSAGRPFTAGAVTELAASGVAFSPIVLHTGVSSAEAGEPPSTEWFKVPIETAERVNDARRRQHRVIAIGTTVVRALESAADPSGRVHPAEGWTDVVVSPERGAPAVDGLLTGWHEPRASHLAMLEAIAGRPLLAASYRAALDEGYLWHEFGDLHLILP
jgi:S-adenosylmethionine:tRNA ribosyltransferase-isomerase